MQAMDDVARGAVHTSRAACTHPPIQVLNQAVERLASQLEEAFPSLPNARWVAIRLLDGDERIDRRRAERRAGRDCATAQHIGDPRQRRTAVPA